MVLAGFLRENEDFEVKTATLEDEECGLTEETLANTDVLIWWGHIAHKRVPDEVAERVHNAVLSGMGFIALHSAHHSKPFRRLMGTGADLGLRCGFVLLQMFRKGKKKNRYPSPQTERRRVHFPPFSPQCFFSLC